MHYRARELYDVISSIGLGQKKEADINGSRHVIFHADSDPLTQGSGSLCYNIDGAPDRIFIYDKMLPFSGESRFFARCRDLAEMLTRHEVNTGVRFNFS